MAGRNNAERPTGYSDPKTVLAIAEFIAGQFAKTIIVFLRQDFGARYFNVTDALGSIATFIAYLFFIGVMFSSDKAPKQPGATPSGNNTVLLLFLLAFVGFSIFHQIRASWRERSGRRWHSRYAGTSFFAFLYPKDSFFVQRYIEPVIALVIGWIIYNFIDQPLGMWLFFAGMCLALTEQIQATRGRNRFLDAIDAQIEAQNLGAALAGNKTAEQTEGFVLPVPRYYSPEQRRALEEGMTRLDPALQAILDTPDEVERPEQQKAPEQLIADMLDPV